MREQRNTLWCSLEKSGKPSSRFLRTLWTVAGTLSLVLGVIGIFLPLLPSTPFFLLSAACYFKGSKRMHEWLLSNKWLGDYIKSYREGRGVPLKIKAASVSALWITIGYSAIYVVNNLVVRVILVFIAVGVTTHIVLLPRLREVKGNS